MAHRRSWDTPCHRAAGCPPLIPYVQILQYHNDGIRNVMHCTIALNNHHTSVPSLYWEPKFGSLIRFIQWCMAEKKLFLFRLAISCPLYMKSWPNGRESDS